MTHRVARGIVDRGEQPFLHVAHGNDTARRLYERLGFATRRHLDFAILLPRQPAFADRPPGHDGLAITDAGRQWIVELDRRRRPTAVALKKGAMTASQDLGDLLHAAASVAVYDTEICLVVAVDDQVGIIPATTGLYDEVRREPSLIDRHLASGAVLWS